MCEERVTLYCTDIRSTKRKSMSVERLAKCLCGHCNVIVVACGKLNLACISGPSVKSEKSRSRCASARNCARDWLKTWRRRALWCVSCLFTSSSPTAHELQRYILVHRVELLLSN